MVEDLDEVDGLLLLGFFLSLFLGFGFGLLDLFIAVFVSRPVRASGDRAALGGTAALVGRTFEVIAETVTGVVGTVCGVGDALERVQDAGVGAAQLMHEEGDLAFDGVAGVAVVLAEAEQVGTAAAGPLAEAVGTGRAAGRGVEVRLFFNVGHNAAGCCGGEAFFDECGIDFVFVAGGCEGRDHAEDHRREHQSHTKQDFQFTHISCSFHRVFCAMCLVHGSMLLFTFCIWVTV